MTALPASLNRLRHLTVLSLVGNCLTDLDDDMFDGMRHLMQLYLDRNKLSRLPKSIGKLKALMVFHVSHNCLVSFPDEIEEMSSLCHLSASDNYISELPAGFGRLGGRMLTLEMDGNMLSGVPGRMWVGWGRLTRLMMQDNKISGTKKGRRREG